MVTLTAVGDVARAIKFRFDDKNSPVPPKNFNTLLSHAKLMLKKKQAKNAEKALLRLAGPSTKAQKALVYFHLARAYAAQKNYRSAMKYNDRALTLYSLWFRGAQVLQLLTALPNEFMYLNLLCNSRNAIYAFWIYSVSNCLSSSI